MLTNALLIIFVPFLLLMFLGMPVGFTFVLIMMAASSIIVGIPAGPALTVTSMFTSIGTFSLAPVPLFILMGELMMHTGLANRAMNAVDKLMGKLPARLSLLSVVTGAIFGMLSGSTMASTAMLGSTIGPDMVERGYDKKMTYGPILASGGLAMIIPPSSLAVIYATNAQISAGRLLIAGLIPGIVMAINYSINIIFRVKRNPSLAPTYEPEEVPMKEKMTLFFRDLFPMVFIIFLVTGVFVIGIATPTEAAALGAIGTLIMAIFYKSVNFTVIVKALKGTVITSTMTLFIIGGSSVFSQLLGYTGFTQSVVAGLLGLQVSKYVMLLIMAGIVIILGMFIESVPIIMMITPIFVPVAAALGFDQIWFGLIMLIVIQMGMTSPPFGMLLFVMKGCAGKDTTMGDMYRTALPFLLSDTVSVLMITFIPALALWLPNLLVG